MASSVKPFLKLRHNLAKKLCEILKYALVIDVLKKRAQVNSKSCNQILWLSHEKTTRYTNDPRQDA